MVVPLATLAAFLPGLRNDFTWEDLGKLRENTQYQGLGWTQLRWMWTTLFAGLYQPVTWMSWDLDFLLWQWNPFGYHLTSLVLHAVTALGMYTLALGLLEVGLTPREESDWTAVRVGAGLAALFFALHPLRAEPVAWVSARGDALAGLFQVWSLVAYVKACGLVGAAPARRGWLATAVSLFALSVASKQNAVTLPAALVILDVYPLHRLGGGPSRWFGPGVRHVWWEKLPFVAVALAVTPAAFLSKARDTTMLPPEPFSPFVGIAKAVFGAIFYLRKTFLPGLVSPVYERPAGLDPWARPFVLSAVAVIAITVLLMRVRRSWPAGLAAWLSYLVLLVPTSGLFAYGSQLVAARYSYVTCCGWAILVGAGPPVAWRACRRGRFGSAVLAWGAGGMVLVLGGLGALTWRQVGVWKSSETVWAYTLQVQPGSALGHLGLGLALEAQGDLVAATGHFHRALATWPEHPLGHLALGRTLARRGALAEAAGHLQAAIRLAPEESEAYVILGDVLAAQGRVGDAIDQYERALRVEPGSAVARERLHGVLLGPGRNPEGRPEGLLD